MIFYIKKGVDIFLLNFLYDRVFRLGLLTGTLKNGWHTIRFWRNFLFKSKSQ